MVLLVKNNWFFRFYNNALKTEKLEIDQEKAKLEYHKKREIDNLKFVQMQIEEKQKQAKKHHGKHKIKVKIEDDYRSSKKLRMR